MREGSSEYWISLFYDLYLFGARNFAFILTLTLIMKESHFYHLHIIDMETKI